MKKLNSDHFISFKSQAIYRQQEEFELMRKVELAEVQRLEADARRKTQEKERRVEQEKDRAAARKTLEVKIAAQSFAHQCFSFITFRFCFGSNY